MRYIDAEKIPYDYTNERGVPMTREIDVQNVPTADVVEIVRCEDCKWYQKGKYTTEENFCFRLLDDNRKPTGYSFPPDGYCSYGER